MKKTEKTLIALIVIGQLMRLFDMVGGSLISLTATLLLTILYVFFGFALFNDIRFREIFRKGSLGIGRREIGLSILFGVALGISITGVVFKLQIFTEANIVLSIGIALVAISLAILAKKFKKTRLYSQTIVRTMIIGGISIVLLATPINWLVDVYYFRDPDQAEIIKDRLRNPG
jgi:hypothetical protein